MAGDFDWAPYVPLMRAMWRDPVTRVRGAAALDRAWADRGTELAAAIELLERAARWDVDAVDEITLVREAARAGNPAQQQYLTLLRYANEARKTQAQLAAAPAPAPAVTADPYHRVA